MVKRLAEAVGLGEHSRFFGSNWPTAQTAKIECPGQNGPPNIDRSRLK